MSEWILVIVLIYGGEEITVSTPGLSQQVCEKARDYALGVLPSSKIASLNRKVKSASCLKHPAK